MTSTAENDVIVTAAMIAIGDELLSGRTKDKNIGFLAEELNKIGIDLNEVRIIGDDRGKIVKTVNEMRSAFDYVFTSGGIGPTHDDITAEAISHAFGHRCIFDDRADAILRQYYQGRGLEYTASRRMMTRMPEGSNLIENSVSAAPGFVIDNVYVLAGVPSVFRAMFNAVLPNLRRGSPYQSISIPCPFGEGTIAEKLQLIQQAHKDVIIGSYPHYDENVFSLDIVVRSRTVEALKHAAADVQALIGEMELAS